MNSAFLNQQQQQQQIPLVENLHLESQPEHADSQSQQENEANPSASQGQNLQEQTSVLVLERQPLHQAPPTISDAFPSDRTGAARESLDDNIVSSIIKSPTLASIYKVSNILYFEKSI